jgi:hypothetical protein
MVARKPRGEVAPAIPTAPAPAGANAVNVVNEKLAASSLRIEKVQIDQCDFLEKNARFMRVEQYQRLVDNIKRDGCLTSVPFAIKQPGKVDTTSRDGVSSVKSPADDRYYILSGNHRVKAAKDAGLTEIMVLYTDQALSHSQQVAIQLSHNAIAGQDDLAILRELYDEINDVVLKGYSGLDDVLLGRMEPPNLDPLSEKGLEYRIVSIAFLPDEVERAEAIFSKVLEQTTGDQTWINRRSDYDRMLDNLTAAKSSAGIKNTATAFGLLLDLAEKHLDEIPQPKPKKTKGAK